MLFSSARAKRLSGRNVPRAKCPLGQNVPGRNVHQAKMSTSQNLRQGEMYRKKGILYTISLPCNVKCTSLHPHTRRHQILYKRFDAPFIAHKVTVKCVFMKTYVLETFDYCMIVCKTKNLCILQNNCQIAYKER